MSQEPIEAMKPALEAGLAELGLAEGEAAAAAAEKLLRYAALLLKWNKVYNLTAIRSADEILTHHLLDSAAAVPFFQSRAPQAKRVLDVGSGGGLPAVPLALLRPDLAVEAVDAVGKKTAFINQAAIELGLRNLRAKHSRVEKLAGSYDVIISRAFASLADFTSLTAHLLAPGGRWFAMKGAAPEAEAAELRLAEVEEVIELRVPGLNEVRHLVILKKI